MGNSISGLIYQLEHNELAVLTSGTTTISEPVADGTNFILAGTSTNAPTLQFIGGIGTANAYSIGSFIADNGNVNVGAGATVDVTNGVQVLGGALNLDQSYGSLVTLDGNSTINGGGSVNDEAGGAYVGAGFIINGTIDVGSVGANGLGLASLDGLGGNGTIRQTGQSDVTDVGAVGSGLHFDIRAGELTIGSSFGTFDGTIGPTNGNGPALGPTGTVDFYPAGFLISEVQGASYDTSTGMLALLASNGRDLANFHFSGNASGLDVSMTAASTGSFVSITDHPGTPSVIPITFS